MSATLVRKSLEICDSDTGTLLKKGDKNLRKLQKLSKKNRSSNSVKSVTEAVKRMRSECDKTEENIKRLELLSSLDVDKGTVKKILHRAVKTKTIKVEEKVEQGTVFTEEDFQKFEKEYFVND